MFEQRFALSHVGFCSLVAISLWFLQFFQLFGSNLFLNGFPNHIMVHSGHIFLFESNFLAVGFFT